LENLLEPPPLNDDLQNFTAGGVGARSGGRQFDCRSGGCCCVATLGKLLCLVADHLSYVERHKTY